MESVDVCGVQQQPKIIFAHFITKKRTTSFHTEMFALSLVSRSSHFTVGCVSQSGGVDVQGT